MLNQRGSLIESGNVRIHARREHVSERSQDCAVSLNPSPESRVAISIGVRQDIAKEFIIHGGGISWFSWNWPLEAILGGLWNRLPSGPVSKRQGSLQAASSN